MHTRIGLVMTVTPLLIAGCANPTRLEADYGRSVRQMINAQTFNPATLTAPSAAPVIGAEPNMVNAAVKELQEGVTLRQETAEPLTIQFGERD